MQSLMNAVWLLVVFTSDKYTYKLVEVAVLDGEKIVLRASQSVFMRLTCLYDIEHHLHNDTININK